LPQAADHSTPDAVEGGQIANLILEPLLPEALPNLLAAVEPSEEIIRVE
jgi:hypothetical protein